jgi:hypothetical protein
LLVAAAAAAFAGESVVELVYEGYVYTAVRESTTRCWAKVMREEEETK